jgi:hypothetical protein
MSEPRPYAGWSTARILLRLALLDEIEDLQEQLAEAVAELAAADGKDSDRPAA